MLTDRAVNGTGDGTTFTPEGDATRGAFIEEMLTPKITYKDVLAGAKEKGLTPAQVAEILGITVGDK
ncbi:MAG: hypothetical protein PUB51_01710 [Oscillospiraceae bacterium]|nr:hypothetical protein [Oscillospiraceae bacterium]